MNWWWWLRFDRRLWR